MVLNFHRRGRNRRGKHVPSPLDGPDHLLRFVSERPTDFKQTLRKGVVGNRSIRPDGIEERGFGDQPAVVLYEVDQNLERLGAKRDYLRSTPQQTGVQIQCEFAKAVLMPRCFSMRWRGVSHHLLTGRAAIQDPRVGTWRCISNEDFRILSLGHHDGDCSRC
jgi:hypothetical protein